MFTRAISSLEFLIVLKHFRVIIKMKAHLCWNSSLSPACMLSNFLRMSLHHCKYFWAWVRFVTHQFKITTIWIFPPKIMYLFKKSIFSANFKNGYNLQRSQVWIIFPAKNQYLKWSNVQFLARKFKVEDRFWFWYSVTFTSLTRTHRTRAFFSSSSGSLNTHDTQDFLRAQIMKRTLKQNLTLLIWCSTFFFPIFLFLDAKLKNHILLSQQESVHDKLKVNGLLLQRINMGTVSHGITFPLVTSPACSDTTPGISFQSAIRTQVLIVTTPTGILETPSIYFVSYLTTHVREIIPTIAPSITSLHL